MNQFLGQKQQIEKHRTEEWLRLEKILLTVVTGTLVLSVTFFTNKVGFVAREYLGLSWISLSSSLVFLLIGYLFSEYSSQYKLKEIDNNKDPYSQTLTHKFFNKILDILNWITAILAIAGVVLLSVFGYLNLIK